MNFEDRYGRLDRLLHRIAFRAGAAQEAMADVEDMVFRDTLEDISLEEPVFITALPRSGTTILLQLLWDTGRFASHTYRDMPFVLCPLLWQAFARFFPVDDTTMERAHGDGLQVSTRSPEAFEEMIWKHFWPDHYRGGSIRPWSSPDGNPAFDAFLESHMRKVIALRRSDPSDQRRYLSKNNLNIARLAAPPGALGRGIFLVTFREPVQQAASMLRQHERFSKLHAEDDFVRRYMVAIGHHEFGDGLRPVDFDGWLEGAPPPERLEFWIRYWIAAYRHVLEHADGRTGVVSYARLTGEPEAALGRLADAMGLPEASGLVSRADRLRPPRTHEVETGPVSDPVLREASELYGALEDRATV